MKSEIRTDFAGDYIAYLFPDGHTETDPPGRPLYREDIQRLRRKLRAQTAAARAVAAEELRRKIPSADLRREAASLTGTADQLESFRQTQKAVARLTTTTSSPRDVLETVVSTIDLGGSVVGDEDNKYPDLGVAPAAPRFVRPAVLDEGIR